MLITYLGQCGFLIRCGETRIVTDPYLSYGVDTRYPNSPVGWKRLYAPPATLDELRPDAVLVSHAHDDHMDPDTLGAYRGDAVLFCPAPEEGALRAMCRPGARIIAARAEKRERVNDVEILPLPCAHTQLHLDEEGRFHELSYIVRYGGHTLFFGGDMSLYDGLAARVAAEKPELMLLPCNGRDEARTRHGIIGNVTAEEAASFCVQTGARAFVPAHHDLYACNGCPTERILRAAADARARVVPLSPMATCALGERGDGHAMEI